MSRWSIAAALCVELAVGAAARAQGPYYQSPPNFQTPQYYQPVASPQAPGYYPQAPGYYPQVPVYPVQYYYPQPVSAASPPPPPANAVPTPEAPPVPQPQPQPAVAPELIPTGDLAASPGNGHSVNWHSETESLVWIAKRQTTPQLVTTGSVNDPIPGALGQPSTVVLVQDLPNALTHYGERVTLGTDFGTAETWGLDVSGFMLFQNSSGVTFGGDGSAGSPLITRPFFNAGTGQEDADPVNVPGVQSGTVNVLLQSKLWGGEVNLRHLLFDNSFSGQTLYLIAGARFLSLEEALTITDEVQTLPDVNGTTSNLRVGDFFGTTNRFYGGQIGALYEDNFVGSAYLRICGKVAAGVNAQRAEMNGSSAFSDSTGLSATSNVSGLLVQASNAGNHTQSSFDVVPELDVSIGYEFNKNLRIDVGYSGLLWNGVIRPGDEVNRVVTVQPIGNPTAFQPAEPTFPGFRLSSFWAQGGTLSIRVLY